MGVLLPWDRKKAAKQGDARSPGALRRIVPVIAVAMALTGYAVVTSIPAPIQVIWDVPDGRVLSFRAGWCLVEASGVIFLMGPSGTSEEIRPAGENERLLLGDGRVVRLAPMTGSERVLALLDDGTVLTQKQASQGDFGEPWTVCAYSAAGNVRWTAEVPGAAALACRLNDRLAIAVTDLSAGALPAVAMLSVKTGDVRWVRQLPGGAWRAIGAAGDDAIVAVLTSGATALDDSGAAMWSHCPDGPVLAATVTGDYTCISYRANRGLQSFVYPYEIKALSPDGSVKWSRLVKQEPVGLQPWKGKEALAVIAENHVQGFDIDDGARLFAERTGEGPINLIGDKLLIRDNRGSRLVRVQSTDLSAP